MMKRTYIEVADQILVQSVNKNERRRETFSDSGMDYQAKNGKTCIIGDSSYTKWRETFAKIAKHFSSK